MNYFIEFESKIIQTLKLIFSHFKAVNDLMVKTNDESLEKLLEKPEDKVKFQKAIDRISKESHSQDVELNGKVVTISA